MKASACGVGGKWLAGWMTAGVDDIWWRAANYPPKKRHTEILVGAKFFHFFLRLYSWVWILFFKEGCSTFKRFIYIFLVVNFHFFFVFFVIKVA